MGVLNEDFEKLQIYCKAIKDIDTIKNNDEIYNDEKSIKDKTRNSRLEALIATLYEVDTKNFDKENVDQIIDIVRNCILKLYKDKQDEINKELKIDKSIVL